ncbi:MAG: LytTR family DNA-binding domain-containing protein [Pseudomonadota bacterium]
MQQWRQIFHRWRELTAHKSRAVTGLERQLNRGGAYRWALALILGVGAGYVGPFGTYNYAPLYFRLPYWIVTITLSFAIWAAIKAIGERFIRNWPYEASETVIMVPFAILNSLALVAMHAASNALLGSRFPTNWSSFFIGHILLTSLVVLPTIYLAKRLVRNASAQGGSDAIRFLTEKLPPQLRGRRPFALAAEGHYVRVYTDAGEGLVTLKFDDALRSVEGIPGVQTHRSWWVAIEQIEAIRRAGSAYEVTLASGLAVPVGRRRYKFIEGVLAKAGKPNADKASTDASIPLNR